MPPNDDEAVVPADGVPRQHHVTLRTACWACDQVLEKQVPRRSHGHRYFNWRCDDCDVAWSGPGDAA